VRRDRIAKLTVRFHLPHRTVRLRLTLIYGGLFLVSGAGVLGITYGLVARRLDAPIRVGGSTAHPGSSGIVTRKLASNSLHAQQIADLHQLLLQSIIALAIMASASIVLGWFIGGRVLRPLRAMTVAARQISDDNLHERLAVDGPNDEIKDLGDTIDALLSRLEAAFAAQQRFVANASHELRTPLTVSRAILQVALADPDVTLNSLRLACLEVLNAGREQEQLIEALLILARSQGGLEHKETFDLAAIARDVSESLHHEASARGLVIKTFLEPSPISGDSRLVERMVTNLLENAQYYNVPNGQVEIAVGHKAGSVSLTVVNTGPRVPDEQISRLIQPFQRIDLERGGEHDGLGLGLSIVQAIATAHNAKLYIQAKASGGLIVEVSFAALGITRNGEPTPSVAS
jgi:signal transduction histidine kinase